MHIDYTGDGIEDVTYQFRFDTPDYRKPGGLIVANFPKITWDGKQFTSCALCQTYSVWKILGKRRHPESARSQIASGPVAPARIGPYTTDHGGADIAAS